MMRAIAQENKGRPFGVEGLREIQLSKRDVLDTMAAARKHFTTDEWKALLLRSIGIEPGSLSERAVNAFFLRMVPFVERNYNIVELGPRGTGQKPSFPAGFALCSSDLRGQSHGGEDVCSHGHGPTRAGVSV